MDDEHASQPLRGKRAWGKAKPRALGDDWKAQPLWGSPSVEPNDSDRRLRRLESLSDVSYNPKTISSLKLI
jgi:hypothetical protein